MNEPELIALLRTFSIEFELFHIEILQEAGPFLISAARQADAAERIATRTEVFTKSVRKRFSRKNAKDAARLLKNADGFADLFRRNVVERLRLASKRTEVEAQAIFEEICRTLEALSFVVDVDYLVTLLTNDESEGGSAENGT